ncbi:hypothetical protein [Aromatoleum diolicum]|nr:hypothetical protein [Aromatoleum diolicum]
MNGKSARGLLIAYTLAAMAGLAGTHHALAADAHDHGAATPVLKLNAGSKWRTDAPLREGMLKIRADVEQKLPAIHAGKFADAQYAALGKAVEAQLAYIVGNCKLEPAADAVLHGVIAEMSDGVEVVTGKKAAGERSNGVVHMVNGLNNYGSYFDHPGWKPVSPKH